MDINEQMIVLPSDTSYSVSNVGDRDKWSTLTEYNKDSREEYAKKVIEEVQEGKSVEEIRREMDRRAREGRERNNKLMEESNRNWKEHQDLVKRMKEKKIINRLKEMELTDELVYAANWFHKLTGYI
jgi:hypothetical protein